MSTQQRYVTPLEELEWSVPSNAATTFKWEYESAREPLLKLYRKGKRMQWDTDVRIDWSQDLDPENPQELPDELMRNDERVAEEFDARTGRALR